MMTKGEIYVKGKQLLFSIVIFSSMCFKVVNSAAKRRSIFGAKSDKTAYTITVIVCDIAGAPIQPVVISIKPIAQLIL